MEKKDKSGEIQSRREFFKQAAKKSLPIIAAATLGSISLFKSEQAKATTCDGCSYTCYSTCQGTCQGKCSGGCAGTCYGECTGSCKYTCSGTCVGTCSGSARR